MTAAESTVKVSRGESRPLACTKSEPMFHNPSNEVSGISAGL